MKQFRLTRGVLSGLYVSVLISFFLFQLLKDLIVNTWTNWFIDFMDVFFNFNAREAEETTWLALLLVCMLVVFIVYRFIVEVLDIHSDAEGSGGFETVILSILILGFLIYTVNLVFEQPMPSSWFSDEMILLFDGKTSSGERFKETWKIVPWLWTMGPIIYMMFRVLGEKFAAGEKD